MKDEWSQREFILHPSAFILRQSMNEETLTKIPELKERLQGVRSYL
jgi:hypothetical protein